MCDKAVNTYPSTIKLVPKCFMTQEMCDKAANKYIFVFHSIPDRYKTQEICNSVVSQDLFLMVYCLDKSKTQIMCYDSLAAFKLVPDWFVTSKMIKIIKTGSIYQMVFLILLLILL